MSDWNARFRLPAADRQVHIERVHLEHASDPASLLCGENRRAGAAEWVENDAIAPAAVADQIADERLVNIEFTVTSCIQAIYPGVIQDIGPMPAIAASEILDVRAGAVLENGDQLVFRAIKAALAKVTLVPDQKILPLGVERAGSSQECRQMRPVDEDVMD